MRITKYKMELDDNRHNILVKENTVNYQGKTFTSPDEITEMLNICFHLNKLAEEHVWLVALTTKGEPLGVFELSHGTANMSLVTPREIFIRLLLSGATNFIMAHNHPSGDSSPSKEDMEVTQKVQECASLIGINFLDHIIVGDNNFMSLKECSLL